MKKTMIYLSLVALVTGTMFNGCKKDNKDSSVTPATTQDNDVETAQDNSLAEITFNDVNTMAGQAVQDNSVSSFRLRSDPSNLLSTCATVTLRPGGDTVIVDFGSTPCQCNDFKFRKGIVIIAFTGLYRDSASVITVTFDNYYVGNSQTNMYKVVGTKTITNKGHNASGHLWFDINVNGSLLNTSNQTMTWTSHRQREWIAGESTLGWGDDQYMISGSINGTNFLGASFTINITQPLHIALNCRWIKDGKFEYTPSGLLTRYVDYGNGGCDNAATVTINGIVFNITLP